MGSNQADVYSCREAQRRTFFHTFHLTRSSPQGLIVPLKGWLTPESTLCSLGLAPLQVLQLPTLHLGRVLAHVILKTHLVAVHQ